MENENMLLGQVTQLIPGAARGAYSDNISNDSDLGYVLKGNSLDTDGGIYTEAMNQVSIVAARNTDRYILQEGDVVVLARGSAIRAGFVTKEVAARKVIASANFIIIRPNKEIIQGEVIAAYLNSTLGRQQLQGLSKGAAIQHIPMSSLRELQIPVPTIEIQKTIADIFYANREAYQATLALAEQQKRTANASILNLMLKAA